MKITDETVDHIQPCIEVTNNEEFAMSYNGNICNINVVDDHADQKKICSNKNNEHEQAFLFYNNLIIFYFLF